MFCIFILHFCARSLRITSLCQVRADTNLVIEKFNFSIFSSLSYHGGNQKSPPPYTLMRTRRRAVCPCYHFSLSASRKTDLLGSITLSAITGGTCRSLTPKGSVRCSEAMFHLPKPRFSQPMRSSAEAFSVKHSVNLLSSSLPFPFYLNSLSQSRGACQAPPHGCPSAFYFFVVSWVYSPFRS